MANRDCWENAKRQQIVGLVQHDIRMRNGVLIILMDVKNFSTNKPRRWTSIFIEATLVVEKMVLIQIGAVRRGGRTDRLSNCGLYSGVHTWPAAPPDFQSNPDPMEYRQPGKLADIAAH